MFIKVRSRTNKLNEENRKSVITDSFVLFDSCTEIRIGTAQSVIRELFDQLTPRTVADIRSGRFDYQAYDGSGIIPNRHYILKDSEVCEKNEQYHYNILEWINTRTGQWHRLTYDTVCFILDDFGRTFNKVQG